MTCRSPEESRGYIEAMEAILEDGAGLESAVRLKLQAEDYTDCDFKTGWIRACEEYVK